MLDQRQQVEGPRWEPIEGTPTMNEHGKSDRVVVPQKSPNKAGSNAAEVMEGSTRAKENPFEQNAHRTQSRESVPSALERIRHMASTSEAGAGCGSAACPDLYGGPAAMPVPTVTVDFPSFARGSPCENCLFLHFFHLGIRDDSSAFYCGATVFPIRPRRK